MKRLIFSLGLLFAGLTAAGGQGINPITPPANWLIPITDPAFANPSNFYTTPALIGSSGQFTSLSVTGGTLANAGSVFTLSATQPAAPSGGQTAVLWNITGAGSASQANTAFQVSYLTGYTGSSTNSVFIANNLNAGSGNVLIPAAGVDTSTATRAVGVSSTGAGTGLNLGLVASAANSSAINVGVLGLAQVAKNSATNIGVVGSAVNTGTTPVMVGGWFSLNQTTNPATSAALVADNGSQTTAIAIFANNATTVATVNQTGGITATLTSASGTSTVCNTAGTSTLLTLVASGTACGSSALWTKHTYPTEALNLVGFDKLRTDIPWAYREDVDSYDGGKVHVGLFADDVEAMDSRCVVYDQQGRLLNYYDRCVLTYLVADRKALKARIAALEEKVH